VNTFGQASQRPGFSGRQTLADLTSLEATTPVASGPLPGGRGQNGVWEDNHIRKENPEKTRTDRLFSGRL